VQLLKENNRLEAPSPRGPLISLRLVAALALMAGLLILAHGCHPPDEDTELFHVVSQIAP
jgi:hypothetical protein